MIPSLVERPAVSEDRFDHSLVVRVEYGDDLRAGQVLAERREVTEVAEQDRHVAALAAGPLQTVLDPGRDLRGEVAPQPLPAELFPRHPAHESERAPARFAADGGRHRGADDGGDDDGDVDDAARHQQRDLERRRTTAAA
jgi:hypothetical protein